MKTYRKRFMALALALLMTIAIPLSAFANENNGADANSGNEQQTPQQTEAENFQPTTEKLTVEKDGPVNIKAGLTNAPNNAEVNITRNVDTSEVGEKIGVLTVKFNDNSTKDVEITVSVTEKTPVPSPTLEISGQKVSSNGYVSGYVKADGLAVEGATVTFYTNDGVSVDSRKTDANGYFEFNVGTEYYNYYYDEYYKDHKVYYDSTYGYYYRNSNNDRVYLNDYYWYGKDYRCGKSGYLLAEKLLYTTSEKAYVTGSCDYNNYYWQGSYDNKYYDYRVYPTSVSRTTSYVKGYLPNEKGRTVSVYSNDYYYDGYYSDGYYDYNGSWHYYNDSNGYYNRYNRNSNYYLGSATVDSDGYFTIYFNRSVPTSESLYYYVDGYKDGRYATVPSVSQAEAGTMLIKGKAGSFASIRVEDAKGTKIGTTTANSDGEFSCYLDRKLSLDETIKVIASESSKYDSQTTYKVVDTSLSGQTYARVSYIKGYPDGTFKPSNNVTRAEAAQMFATLLNGGTIFGTSSVTKFTDANNKWYSPAVNYIAGKGLLSGYSDGTFKPDADITRAEFAQMISGYLKAGYAGSANFKDVKGHWASDAIDKVFGNKAVEGYPDGTFKPNKTLTRAEAVTVLNAVFNRYTTSNSLKNVSSSNLKNYSDISSSHWAYYQILDASNVHVSQKVTSTSNEEVWK
ncbi:cell surface protein [Peptoniphilus lacrimalis DNF00528]|nr:cell surface protein [Peptoniphilus lacrimalis DNF00528]